MRYLDIPANDEEDEDSSLQVRREKGPSGLDPHVFFIANSALRCLVKAGRSTANYKASIAINQSIIVSGESGAG
jgi:myosin heavy subunit